MVTKYKIAVNTAQPQTQAQQQVIQQIAQNAANQQLQQQAQAQAEAVDPLRQSVNDLLKSKIMNNIDVPQYTTINDVLNAKKGDRLSTFADFLNNPQTMRTIGNFLPSYGYNPKTGKVNNVMEGAAQEQEALMQAKQAQAMQQLKEQNDIATALNNAYMTSDIHKADREAKQKQFEEEMKWAKEKYAQDLALEQQKLNALIQHQKAMEGIAWHNANNKSGKKINQKTSNVINKNGAAISKIDALISMLEDSKNKNSKAHGATGFWQGVQAESSFRPVVQNLNNNSTEEQIGLRSQLADLGSMTITDRSGTAQTVNELKRLRPFIADAYDSPQTAIAKLKSMRNNIMNETNFYLQSEGLSPEDFGIGSSYNGKTDNSSQPLKVGGYTVRVKGK